ncbi:MAG: type II secretion system protein [Nitrospirota bacterium]
MIKKQDGFTLVELMITMVVFVFVIAAASQVFVGLLNQFKQQSKIAETNIEGIVGLQMLRSDIEQAGYGLPFNINGASYNEAANDAATAHDDTAYNDSTTNPPRALLLDDNTGLNSSDILVIKATNIALNDPSHKWSYITNTAAGNVIQVWRDINGTAITDENLQTNDRVIVLMPILGPQQRVLVNTGPATFFTTFTGGATPSIPAAFSPVNGSFETYLIYGIKPAGGPPAVEPRMPFNRADYYIKVPGTLPQRCAPGTGVLYKATINHDNGNLTELPILDCVADMQLVAALDSDDNGATDSFSTSLLAGTTAEGIRNQLREVRVYILAHEGQLDINYTYPNATINITDPDAGLLKAFDLNATIGASNVNYRWKIYRMAVRPYNLR